MMKKLRPQNASERFNVHASLALALILVTTTQVMSGPKEDHATAESAYLKNITRVTFESMGIINAGEGYFSPDGKTIIFQATPKGKDEYQIYTMTLGSSEPKMVSTGKGACTCAYYHPSGKKIIFASSHLDPGLDNDKQKIHTEGYQWDFNEFMDIFEASPDGSNLKRLTNAPGYDAEGSYSADGKRIVFTSQRDKDLEIYVMDADGKNQRRITDAKGYDGGPFFSPNGKMILYRGDRRGDGKMNLQIRIAATDGSSDTAITNNPIFNWCPYWSKNGKSFIYTEADHEAYAKGGRPNYDLYMMDLHGKNKTRITFDRNFDGLPVFSPDGKKLLWTSQRGNLEEAHLFIADFVPPEIFRK